jgi:polysaccharide pyruvyl transferase WcaK-like protein
MEVKSPLSMRRVFVDHGEAYGNLGDEAMLLSALRRLTSSIGPCHFVIPRESSRPLPRLDDFAVEYVPSPFLFFDKMASVFDRYRGLLARMRLPVPDGGLRSKVAFARLAWLGLRLGISRHDYGLREAMQAIGQCDVFYGVGAADFNDFNAFGAAYKCWLYRMVRPLVPVVAISAQGFGPLENTELKVLMASAFDDVDLLGFRDHSFSDRFTRGLGPPRCQTRITGDEAFSLASAGPVARDTYLAETGLMPGESFIAVHWRSTDYTQDTDHLFLHVAKLWETAAQLSGLRLVFFPMSYDVHSRHDDACCQIIRSMMSLPDRLLMAPVSHDVGLIKAAIGVSRFTLGLSYHIHIFGLSQGVPALILYSGDYYRFKSDGLAAFYGGVNQALNIGTPAGIANARVAIEAMLADERGAPAAISSTNKALAEVNDWILGEISARLEGVGR